MADHSENSDSRKQVKESARISDSADDLSSTVTSIEPAPWKMTQAVNLASFFPNYEVLGLVGEGGMSEVYKARHRMLNHLVAIKMLHSHLLKDELQSRRFTQEGQALFTLDHQNIVTVREFGDQDDKPYLIMDYIEGRSLADEIREAGPVAVRRALTIFVQACLALEHAHMKGIIHRDIKPSNLMLTTGEDGQDLVKVVDFGIAKITQDGDINPRLTQTGDVFGSPLYMSPEQCLGEKLDARTDIYALGCVMYETLSGHPPFAAATALATTHLQLNEMPPPIVIQNCPDPLRDRLDEVIFKSLEKNPAKRYGSVAQLRADLEELSQPDHSLRRSHGGYLKVARLQRKLTNSIKAQPLLWLILPLIAVVLIFIASWLFMRVSPLLVEPHQMSVIDSIRWTPDIPTVKSSIRFADKFRDGAFIVEQHERGSGLDSADTIRVKEELAMFLMAYGRYSEARRYLSDVFNHFLHAKTIGKDDFLTQDTAQKLGDCYYYENEFDKAAYYYRLVADGYFKNPGIEETERSTICLKLANALIHLDSLALARDYYFKAVKLSGGQSERLCQGLSGMADCDFLEANRTVSPKERKKYFARVQREYLGSRFCWNQLVPPHTVDIAHCDLRLADIALAQQQYRDAVDLYAKVRTEDPSNSLALNLKDLNENLKRILWRAHRWFDALKGS